MNLPPCPVCSGTLRIEKRLKAKKLGTYAIAGASDKILATEIPWIVCSYCGIEAEGKFE
jgi:hypothetical protein